MGQKVNLYLDDECLDRWNSIPPGERSQVVRQALLNQYQNDSTEDRERLLLQQLKRELVAICHDLDNLEQKKEHLELKIEKALLSGIEF